MNEYSYKAMPSIWYDRRLRQRQRSHRGALQAAPRNSEQLQGGHETYHGRLGEQLDTVSNILNVHSKHGTKPRTPGVSMAIQLPELRPQPHPFPRSEEETILESSLESFPASDPPAWVYGKDKPPKPPPSAERPHSEARKSGRLKRLVERFKQRARSFKDNSSNDRPCCQGPH
jgi:hypothetical protein